MDGDSVAVHSPNIGIVLAGSIFFLNFPKGKEHDLLLQSQFSRPQSHFLKINKLKERK